jgi:hypothetical protein
MKGQANPIIGGVIGVVTGVIGLVIVFGVVTGTSFGSGVLNTVVWNIPVLMGVSLLALAGGWLFMR